MKCAGSGSNGELTFLDVLSIASFLIGLQNLDMNITQEDMDETSQRLDATLREQVTDIHHHLTIQDAKIDAIINALKGVHDDGRGYF